MKTLLSILATVSLLCVAARAEEPAKADPTKAAPMPKIPEGAEVITLGAGCFWCTEAVFQQVPGVLSVTSGYMGGASKNPTYEQICTGTTGHAVDRAARAQIEAAGLGDYFIHRTGHGLGLEVHEEPDMKQGEHLQLEPGMTFTIEPGVYLPGIGGVRIEDNMVITATGAESLTTLARELVPLA